MSEKPSDREKRVGQYTAGNWQFLYHTRPDEKCAEIMECGYEVASGLGRNRARRRLGWRGPDANADGNAERGKVLAYTCHGCHGVPDYKNAFPNYSVPKLGGQNAEYLMSALNAYASGDRAHQTMHSQAATLSDQDRADIAAYLQSEAAQPNKQVVGTPPPATQTCVSCHGADGAKTIGPDVSDPRLAVPG